MANNNTTFHSYPGLGESWRNSCCRYLGGVVRVGVDGRDRECMCVCVCVCRIYIYIYMYIYIPEMYLNYRIPWLSTPVCLVCLLCKRRSGCRPKVARCWKMCVSGVRVKWKVFEQEILDLLFCWLGALIEACGNGLLYFAFFFYTLLLTS